MEETRRSLPAVQGLRAIALLAIVIYHCGNPALYQAGVWGAGVFFILSGYLRGCACESCGYTPSKTIRPLLSFTAARLKQLYPLHIIMLILSFPVSDMPASLQADGASKLPFWGVVILMNLTLTKSFYPDYYFSFNGVTWFLSSYMALLFLTLPLQYLMTRLLKSDTARLLFAGSLYLFHAGFCLFISRVTSNVMYWTYIFPLAHLPGYVLGMAAGRSLTIRRKCSRSKFLSKIFKINVKNFREIFPDFTHRKKGSEFITVPFLSSGSHVLRLPSAFLFLVPCLEYTLSVLQQSSLTPHISGLYALLSN